MLLHIREQIEHFLNGSAQKFHADFVKAFATKDWKQFIHKLKTDQKIGIDEVENLMCYKFYGLSHHLSKQIDIVQDHVKKRIFFTKDDRCLHQLYILNEYLQDLRDDCRLIDDRLQELMPFVDPCVKHKNTSPHTRSCVMKKISKNVSMCRYFIFKYRNESQNLFHEFLRLWFQDLYHVYRMYVCGTLLNGFYFCYHDIDIGIDQWQVVCENDDIKILAHPSLSHPDDFLTYRKNISGNRYADKAQLSYFFANTIHKQAIVFSKTRRVIPLVSSRSSVPNEIIIRNPKKTQQSYLYSGSTTIRKSLKKKKKLLSRILKETRKKKKKNLRKWKPDYFIEEEIDTCDVIEEREDDFIYNYYL